MKKHIKLISIIMLLLIIIISGTYAFYNARVNKIGDGVAEVSTKTLKLELTDGPAIELNGVLPGQKIIKTFTVTNSDNTIQNYYINLVDVVNNLERKSDLVLSLTSTNDGAIIDELVFPSSSESITSLITIAPTTTQEYTLTIEYKNTDINQITDMNKVIHGTINIDNLIIENKSEFAYTGHSESFTANKTGPYLVELWGAQGGTQTNLNGGAYTSGVINLNKNDVLYVYVGGCGAKDRVATFNGGGYGGDSGTGSGYYGNSGGGATDVRLVGGEWNNIESLASRIMVAAGSGGGTLQLYESAGEHSIAGGLIGGQGGYYEGHPHIHQNGYGGTQTAGGLEGRNHFGATGINNPGTFGIGGSSDSISSSLGAGGGGGGYYGGGAGGGTQSLGNGQGGGGGSSYISGYQGCIAITSQTDISPRKVNNTICDDTLASSNIECSYHYSGKIFSNTVMADGDDEMPTHDGTGTMTGNTGAGFAKITYIES